LGCSNFHECDALWFVKIGKISVITASSIFPSPFSSFHSEIPTIGMLGFFIKALQSLLFFFLDEFLYCVSD
jgi:hypothetical protein